MVRNKMNEALQRMREIHKKIDEYTERWVEGNRDEREWNSMVETYLIVSGLEQSETDSLRKNAEGKKRWHLHLKGLLVDDEFGGEETRP